MPSRSSTIPLLLLAVFGKAHSCAQFFAPALMTRSVTLSPLSRRVFRARCFIVDDMDEKELFTFFIKYHNFAFWPIKWLVSWLKKIDLKTLNVSLDSASDSFIHLSCATKTPLRLLHSYTRRNNNIWALVTNSRFSAIACNYGHIWKRKRNILFCIMIKKHLETSQINFRKDGVALARPNPPRWFSG